MTKHFPSCSCTINTQFCKTKGNFPNVRIPKVILHWFMPKRSHSVVYQGIYSTYLTLLLQDTSDHWTIKAITFFPCTRICRNRKIQNPLQWIEKEKWPRIRLPLLEFNNDIMWWFFIFRTGQNLDVFLATFQNTNKKHCILCSKIALTKMVGCVSLYPHYKKTKCTPNLWSRRQG